MRAWGDARQPLVAVLAIACLTPAAVFLLAVVGRLPDPAMFEPAPVFSVIFDWFEHLGLACLACLLLAMPAIGTALAGGLVWRSWRADDALRSDLATFARAVIRLLRRPAFVLGIVALVFGLCYFATVLVHALAG